MEHKPSDPICVLKVDVNCCKECQTKLRKVLLGLNDVLWVDYDAKNKWAIVRGKCQPSVLVKCINKLGKAAEVVSYYKDPSKAPNSLLDNCNKAHEKSSNNKGKKKVCPDDSDEDYSCHAKGKKKVYPSNSDGDDVDDCVKDFKEKKKHNHKHEEYAPPPKVDENICRDQFCTIHRRSVNNGPMGWNHFAARMGPNYGQFGMPPVVRQHPYRYHGPLSMAASGYGFCANQFSMPGMEFTNNFFQNENPARGCNTM